MSVTVAAVDLGATSGRVLIGTLHERKLTLHECARFPNGPVPLPRERGQDLVWDLPYLWQHIVEGVRSAAAASPIDSIGIDSWAVDYGLLDSNGRLLASPAAYRSDRTTDAVSAILDAVDRRWLYKANGLQLQPFNTIFQLLADRDDPRSAGAQRMLLVPDLDRLLANRSATLRDHQRIDHRPPGPPDTRVESPCCGAASRALCDQRAGAAAAADRAGRDHRGGADSWTVAAHQHRCADASDRRRLPRHCLGGRSCPGRGHRCGWRWRQRR
jgi:hypothetical protein